MNRIRPAQYPFIPGSLKGGGGGGMLPEQVDGGYFSTTTTDTNYAWTSTIIPLYVTLDDLSKYWLEVDFHRNRPTTSGFSFNPGADALLTSPTQITLYYQGDPAGTCGLTWRLFRVPGVVQRGRYSWATGGTGLRYCDIALSIPVKRISNAFINLPWYKETRSSSSATNQHTLGVYRVELTAVGNLRIYAAVDDNATYYMPWQVWDPEG
jgi:hypothetical protein